MDRTSFKRWFNEISVPPWVCPTCGKGYLQLQAGSLCRGERVRTRDHQHEAFEPEWIEYVYSCMFICSNALCKEFVSSSGTGGVDIDYSHDHNGEVDASYQDFFRPHIFEPPLKIIAIPANCPDSVSEPLTESFRLALMAPSAAANSIRIAVENILTDLKIKRFRVKDGKRRFVTLHERIALIPPEYVELKDLVLAVKWLGNSGSHDHGVLTLDDVLDAYELTEHILSQIYGPKPKHLKALAKRVNKKRGPVKKD